MAAIPQTILVSPTVQAIYRAYEAANKPRLSRRLGASIIGHPCARKTWMDFRWAGQETFDGRMLRLFDTGHREEIRFAEDLRAVGAEVHLVDPETGEQFEYTAVSGHVVVKLDGAAIGIPESPKNWHSLEFKTHSAKSFKPLYEAGLKVAKPEHYAQTIVGLKLSGLTRALYLARNKDTDELYAERFRLEDVGADADRLIEYARQIVTAARAPERIADNPDKFPCRFCPHKDRCHGSTAPAPAVPVLISCRSCVNATADLAGESGRWGCEKHNKTLDVQAQERACPDHLFIPDFVTFADVSDGGYDADGDWIEFTNRDGSVWEHSRRKPSAYKSTELTVLPSPMVGYRGDEKELTVHSLKEQLGGEVVEEVNA